MHTIRMLAPLCCLALGACATGGQGGEARRVDYACDDGTRVEVSFLPAAGAAVLRRGGTSIRLARRPAASGFAYAADGTTIRGKGDALRVESGAAAVLRCAAD